MNDPITNMNSKNARSLRLMITLSLMGLLMLIGGCWREDAPAITGASAPTSTSAAVLAATSTAPAENPTAASAEPQADQDTASEEATSRSGAPNPTTTSGNTDNTEQPTVCETEIALDLVGHPQYAELISQLGCPLASASLEPVAINEFGPGPEFDRFMLWFSTTTQIYILKPDRVWESAADTWAEDEAEIQCNPTDGEMTSPPLPRRGFGKLWCADEVLQKTMGTIIREERLCQHTVLQEFDNGLLLGCFEDATIRYLQIFNDGSWDMRFVQ